MIISLDVGVFFYK